MSKVALLLPALAAVLVAAPVAAAAAPWDGGPTVRSAVEQKLDDVGASLAGPRGPWEYVCESPDEWAQLIAPDDPAEVWGAVFPEAAPNIAWLSPQSCLGVERVIAGKVGSKACHTGDEPRYEWRDVKQKYWATVRKQVPRLKRVTITRNGTRRVTTRKVMEWRTVRVQRTRIVSRQAQVGTTPLYGTCSDWAAVLFGAQTAAHETIHLVGVGDEAVAECYGMQILGLWVWLLSGDQAFGAESAADYWTWYQAHRPGTDYGSYDCVPGGALDLDVSHGEWPVFVGDG
jgi:hypothetical protein